MTKTQLSIRLLFATVAVAAVIAVFATQWGPDLDGNGNPWSASDGMDYFGFPFTHRIFDGGNCEAGPCGGSYESTPKLMANFAIAAASAVGLGALGWRLGALVTQGASTVADRTDLENVRRHQG